jgi:hypothetical protein
MRLGLVRGGSIVQILCVLAFVFVSTRVVPVCVSPEAMAIAPLVEDGMAHEAKVAAPDHSLVLVPTYLAPEPGSGLAATATEALTVSVTHTIQHAVLRL